MMKRYSHLPLPVLLALAHALAVLLVYMEHYEGSWGGIFFAIPDLPVIVLLGFCKSFLSFEGYWLVLAIFGSLWWYFLGYLLARIWRMRSKRLANSAYDTQPKH
ncbi:hypothetical protein [Rhodoferax antarcticus]|uniref:hypothetical protein n=1 Tax=Rhodoferax antarcticus TaxID=81479 RepID=UPI001A7E0895|nr:hypothetical protein [Rhodoferax antarcticus]